MSSHFYYIVATLLTHPLYMSYHSYLCPAIFIISLPPSQPSLSSLSSHFYYIVATLSTHPIVHILSPAIFIISLPPSLHVLSYLYLSCPAIFIISLKRCEDLQERADWLKYFPGTCSRYYPLLPPTISMILTPSYRSFTTNCY